MLLPPPFSLFDCRHVVYADHYFAALCRLIRYAATLSFVFVAYALLR